MKTATKTQILLVTSVVVFAGTIFIGIDIVNTVWPCDFNICSDIVKTVTLSSAELYGGSLATTSTNGTSDLSISLNNPGSTTYITSLTLQAAVLLL